MKFPMIQQNSKNKNVSEYQARRLDCDTHTQIQPLNNLCTCWYDKKPFLQRQFRTVTKMLKFKKGNQLKITNEHMHINLLVDGRSSYLQKVMIIHVCIWESFGVLCI